MKEPLRTRNPWRLFLWERRWTDAKQTKEAFEWKWHAWSEQSDCAVQVVSLDYTRKERGLLGEPSQVGAVQISIRKASREWRGGHACKITKWKVRIWSRWIYLWGKQLRRLNIFCFEIIRNLKTLRRFGKEAGNFFFALRVKELLDGTKRWAMKHQGLFHMLLT